MKYYKTTFKFSSTDASDAIDNETMNTARELCAALAGTAGYESFEDTDCGINGYVQKDLLDQDTLKEIIYAFPLEGINIDYKTEDAEDRNWNEEWEKEGFEPLIIEDRCRIHDIYHEVDGSYPIDIEIDAKQAFGTGTHNTTQMIVGQLTEMNLNGKRVLDCGCGTGILSIVASKCGAKEITAYDIDEWSVENTRHNAAINNVCNITPVLGDASILKGLNGTFDVVLANINRNILLNDMPAMADKMHAGTLYIISGFYSSDVPLLRSKANSLGLEYISQNSSEDWTLIIFKKL